MLSFDYRAVLTNPRLAEVVARANAQASGLGEPFDGLCHRNWTDMCPAGQFECVVRVLGIWWLSGWDREGPVCSAPACYRGARRMSFFFRADCATCGAGACSTVQSFAAASLAEKVKFATECDSPWPCIAETGTVKIQCLGWHRA